VKRVLGDYGHAERVDMQQVHEPVGQACQNCGNVAGPVLPTVCPNCRFRDISACPVCHEEVPRETYARIGGDLFRCPHCHNRVRLRFNEPMFLGDGMYNQPLVVVEQASGGQKSGACSPGGGSRRRFLIGNETGSSTAARTHLPLRHHGWACFPQPIRSGNTPLQASLDDFLNSRYFDLSNSSAFLTTGYGKHPGQAIGDHTAQLSVSRRFREMMRANFGEALAAKAAKRRLPAASSREIHSIRPLAESSSVAWVADLGGRNLHNPALHGFPIFVPRLFTMQISKRSRWKNRTDLT
jgi:hypothetical protein